MKTLKLLAFEKLSRIRQMDSIARFVSVESYVSSFLGISFIISTLFPLKESTIIWTKIFLQGSFNGLLCLIIMALFRLSKNCPIISSLALIIAIFILAIANVYVTNYFAYYWEIPAEIQGHP